MTKFTSRLNRNTSTQMRVVHEADLRAIGGGVIEESGQRPCPAVKAVSDAYDAAVLATTDLMEAVFGL
jgi:hypothetical protein